MIFGIKQFDEYNDEKFIQFEQSLELENPLL
jgi:hypothetical protein